MEIYMFDGETKEYIGAEDALLDPLETKKQGKPVCTGRTFLYALLWGCDWKYQPAGISDGAIPGASCKGTAGEH